ncbi:MAG: ABC transporter substrate-binding protein [Pseudolabrys sp.]|jgi:putative ABC transport system substrate-binding protein
MKRREFISLVGGAAAWPFAARAQQGDRMRRIGMLMNRAEDDPEGQAIVAVFVQTLQSLGWNSGRNVQIDIRWGVSDAASSRRYAAEMVALAPDVILTGASAATAAAHEATRTLPIVFVNVSDPVGAGYVASLARPGGNVTGFSFVEYGMGGKWLELLKEIAPRVTRVAILRDPTLAVGIGQLGAIQSVAPSFRVEASPIDVRNADEIEHAITDFARTVNGGLIVTASPGGLVHRKLIITLAAQHRLPTVYFLRGFVKDGGLISYGPDTLAQYKQAASYVDRILKGEKPADLPVQAPTKNELVINLKTAKGLGLTVPSSVLSRADEVIE